MVAVIELELFGEGHVPGVVALLDDPAVLRFTRIPEPVPEDFAAGTRIMLDEIVRLPNGRQRCERRWVNA